MTDKNDKVFKFAESIPLDELFDEIRVITGISDLKFTSKIDEDRYGMPYIQFQSQDLVEHVGFLKLMFKTIIISTFNSQIVHDKDEDKYRYWGTASFRYDHPSNGSNGYTFLTFWYDKKWQFEVVGNNERGI